MKKLTGIFFALVILVRPGSPVYPGPSTSEGDRSGTATAASLLSTEFTQRYNIHTVTAGQCYRSKLIGEPDDLRKTLAVLGIKTVLNVCGPCPNEPWWGREKTICIEQGVRHVDITLQAEAFSDPQMVTEVLKAFDTQPRPFLIHCMRGADRTGEAVALWQRHVQKAPASVALDAIDWRFNHNPFTHWEKRMFMRWLYQQDTAVGDIPKRGIISKSDVIPACPESRDTFTNTHCVEQGQLHRSHYLYPHELSAYLTNHAIGTVIVLEELLSRRGVHGRDYERICKHHGVGLHEIPLAAHMTASSPLAVPFVADERRLVGDPSDIDISAGSRLQELFRQAPKPILVTCLTGAELCSEAVAWWHHLHGQLSEELVQSLFSGQFHCVPGLAQSRRSFFKKKAQD